MLNLTIHRNLPVKSYLPFKLLAAFLVLLPIICLSLLKIFAFETKPQISRLIKHFKNKSLFNTSEIVAFYRLLEPDIPRTTINWRVYYLVQSGILERTGRGKFKLGQETPYHPELDNRFPRLNNLIIKQFPYIEYCLWTSASIIEFGQHIPKTNLTLIDVERVSAESVFHFLKEEYKQVFLRPSKELLNNYISELDKAYIIRTLVTESPVQLIKGIPTITIEKLLIDIYTDEEFAFAAGNELVHIFENAFNRYTVKMSKLIRYADRKRKKKEIINFLKNYNLAAE